MVAIKKCKRIFEDLVDCKRILREVSILSKLSHRNVVQVLDFFIPGDMKSFTEIYMIMELCDSDLKKLCRWPLLLFEACYVYLCLYQTLCRQDVTLSPIHETWLGLTCHENETVDIAKCPGEHSFVQPPSRPELHSLRGDLSSRSEACKLLCEPGDQIVAYCCYLLFGGHPFNLLGSGFRTEMKAAFEPGLHCEDWRLWPLPCHRRLKSKSFRHFVYSSDSSSMAIW